MDRGAFSLRPFQGVGVYWTIHARALQGEEMTLPPLPRLCPSALVPVCSVAGAGAAPRLLWPIPGCIPLPGASWAHICTACPSSSPPSDSLRDPQGLFQEPLAKLNVALKLAPQIHYFWGCVPKGF